MKDSGFRIQDLRKIRVSRNLSLVRRFLIPHSVFRNRHSKGGFTLLEVIIALALLGIAVTVVLQLFSSNMRSIAASEDYVYAASQAEARMREVLDDDKLEEKSWSETTGDGYRIDVSITNTLKERTENLGVNIFEINLVLHWAKGNKERSVSLKTMKVVNKQI